MKFYCSGQLPKIISNKDILNNCKMLKFKYDNHPFCLYDIFEWFFKIMDQHGQENSRAIY